MSLPLFPLPAATTTVPDIARTAAVEADHAALHMEGSFDGMEHVTEAERHFACLWIDLERLLLCGRDRNAEERQYPQSPRNEVFHLYQGSSSPMWMNLPFGPSGPINAMATLVFAPSGISIGAASVPISVFTQPG